MTISNMIKTLRKEKGWTQKELANQLHVAQNTISQWETGAREIDHDSLQQLLTLSQANLTLQTSRPVGRLRLDYKQGDATFYHDEKGHRFQQVEGWSQVEPLTDESSFVIVGECEGYLIKYDLTGERGFSVWKEGDNQCFFDGIWELHQVEEEIYDSLPLYCGCCGEELDGFVPCESCHQLVCPDCVTSEDLEDDAICCCCLK